MGKEVMVNNKKVIEKESEIMLKIIDSQMGAGKTSYLIEKMKKDKRHKFIYITPFLDEVKRIETECKENKFVQPTNKNKFGSKLEGLKQLIIKGRNITSTHSLFSMADEELIMLLKSNNYILVLDEVMDVVQQVENITSDDIKNLFDQELIEISDEENGMVKWIAEGYNGRYNDIMAMAEAKTLYYVNNTLMVWAMPVEIFKVFDEIYLSTYLFDYQIQKYYYDYFNIEYEYYHIEGERGNYRLVKTENFDYDLDFRRKAKELITIVDNEKLNAIGEDEFSLSKKWFSKPTNKIKVKQLQKNMYDFFRHISETPSDDNMWTCFKDDKNKLKGSGYTKGFIACNSRATNEFANKSALVYTINRYINPFYKAFFRVRDIEIDEDGFALSELLQWIWRSRIRKGEPIIIYIPSKRMRELLKDFLDV